MRTTDFRVIPDVLLLLTMMVWVAYQGSSAQAMPEIVDNGDFILSDATADESSVARYLNRPDLKKVLADINDEINLAQDVEIMFLPWAKIRRVYANEGQKVGADANAFYDPDEKFILIGYELINDIENQFSRNYDGDDVDEMIYPNVVQTLLHEMGHALIDVNGIPEPSGEDPHLAADQLAFFIMAELYDSEEELLPVVMHYKYRHEEFESNTAGDHQTDDQRGENYLCWMYGKWDSLEKKSWKKEASWEDEESNDDCVSEYDDLRNAWHQKLGPSWKSSY